MIRRLHLHNWRTYEDLDLILGPGTTFVVAPNGVGKTSLVYGLAWAVFGDYSGIDPKPCIRAGTDRAVVRAHLDLPDGSQLVISRVAKHRGAARATYQINGTQLGEKAARAQMEQALGVELAVASRLAMMLGGAHLAAHRELNLETHLHDAFGVAHLVEAVMTAQSVAKEATKARAAFRTSVNKRLGDRSAMETEIAELQTEISRLNNLGLTLEHLRDTAVTQRSLVERHSAMTDQLQSYARTRSKLIADAHELLGRSVATEDRNAIASSLCNQLQRSRNALSQIGKDTVKEGSTVAAAREAIALLDRDTPLCPTCMRPITRQERHSARSVQAARERTSQAEAERLKTARKEEQTRSEALSQLLARFDALQPPPKLPDQPPVPNRADAEAFFRDASRALDDHNRELGAAQSRLEFLRKRVASDDQLRRDERELQLAYRREGLALAGASALRAAADRVTASRIAPIANEVRWRWKQLFADGGLTLKADGTIARVHAGRELGWDTLSGGERTWARIVTHLLVIATTTSLPFAWFDEPLEHLDPRLRHAVAATLATTTMSGTPRQLIVTTYEHTLARQLADDTDNAAIIAIRQSGDYQQSGPPIPSGQHARRAS